MAQQASGMNRGPLDLRVQWLIVIALLGAALYWLGPVLTPFVIAGLFAYLCDPLVDRMERLGLGRALAVSIVFLVIGLLLIAFVLILVPFTERQIGNLIGQLPKWMAWFQTVAAPWLHDHFGISPLTLDTERLTGVLQQHWKEAGGAAAVVLGKVSQSGMFLVNLAVGFVLVPVVGFYLLRDWDLLVERVSTLVPRGAAPTVTRLARESDQVLGAFLRGQLSVMIALGVIYGVGLWLVGIDVGPLIGMIAGLISFVPFLGAIVGVVMALVAALVQYHDWLHVVLVAAVFAVGQALEGYVLVPKLVGDRIGLHPVAVIFAVLAGGELFGFIGVLVALPVAAVAMVLLRYAHERYRHSAMYQSGAEPRIVAPGQPDAGEPVVVEPVVDGVDGKPVANVPAANPEGPGAT